jgi:hypothetical protein
VISHRIRISVHIFSKFCGMSPTTPFLAATYTHYTFMLTSRKYYLSTCYKFTQNPLMKKTSDAKE